MISRCNKTVPRNDDFTATLERFLRDKRVCHTIAFSLVLLPSSLSTVDAREVNENVRRDRIIHCPTKTGGTSRLFGERITLFELPRSSMETERSVLVILEILSSDLFYVLQIYSEKRLYPYRKVAPSYYCYLLYFTITVIYAKIIHFKKHTGYIK